MKAHIVIGLGFGDEGKGLVTDWLCSKNSGTTLVVRFSGGQQAGHTVMIDGKKHVHSNYGSGTLRGFPSYFSEHTTIYLNTLYNEREALRKLGKQPCLWVHPLAKLTTPYDVAWNRFWEKRNRHGSCGLGIAATHKRSEEGHLQLYAMDIKYPEIFHQKCEAIKNYYMSKFLGDLAKLNEFEALWKDSEEFFTRCYREYLFYIADYDFLRGHNLVFEGSQGIMLDQHHGFFPNVTWGNTTSKNAIDICQKIGIHHQDIVTYYVTRCYQTRHGNGWMSNRIPIDLINNEEEINILNPWQGEFKVGELDYDLLNYALEVDSMYNKSSKELVVTCLDQRPEFEFDHLKLRRAFGYIYGNSSPEANLTEIFSYMGSKVN